MSALELRSVGHAFLGRSVLDGVDLAVDTGEILALVGPSGCGKSTLAHIAAGVIEPLRGRVTRRYARHGMVFQDPRLLPWATAAGNILYPLRILGLARAERRERLAAVAAMVALADEDLTKYPAELSGGMKQRVAVARALAVEPDLVYFDEPFTALDVALKRRMQDLVVAAAAAARFGGLFITHDLMEAARIAHRVAVMNVRGRGLLGTRAVPGTPGGRDERALFELVQAWLAEDPTFFHVNDVDERRRP